MREQIVTGLYNASMSADEIRQPELAALSMADINILADAVLASLSNAPDSTPTPQMVEAPAQTVFTIDPAMVVARQARLALSSTEADPNWQVNPSYLMDTQTFAAESEQTTRETREFLFAVQEMFGCKVRCVRAGEGERRFLVAGNLAQRNAMMETLDSFISYAQPLLADLSSEQRREFWATLGAMVAESDDAEVLIEANRVNYSEACAAMIDLYGPARTLTRAAVATEGPVYDLAASTVNPTR